MQHYTTLCNTISSNIGAVQPLFLGRRGAGIIRELKHVGRQHDDDGQNKFLQINDSKENLSYIIIRMNLIQYKKLKTLALCLGRVLLTEF